MPHPCALIEEGMQGFEACELGKAAYAADKVLGDAPATVVTSLKEVLVANAPAITARLNAAMGKIGEWVEQAEGFATEQTPLLVKEIIYWGVADAGYWVGFGALFLTFAAVWSFMCYKRWTAIREMRGDFGDFFRFMVGAAPIVTTLLGFIFVMANIMDMLKPIVAPRLYLIEYFRHLAK